jgi:hypothetical protein
MKKIGRFLAVFCFVLMLTLVIQATVYCQEAPQICPYNLALDVGGGYTRTIPYCWNYNPEAPGTTSIVRAVIVIHGVERNAKDYYNYVLNSADAVGVAGETVIIAPQFLLQSDTSDRNTVVWKSNTEGWSMGDHSCTEDGTCAGAPTGTISSFGVIDTILGLLSNRANFPNLSEIVVTGHSAGGQFTNRYSAGGQAEGKTVPKRIKMRYVVANPSSYVYFTKERWDNTDLRPLFLFRVLDPDEVQACPTYNDYRFGLDNLNAYMAATGKGKIQRQLRQRKVVYLLGGIDTDGPNLDTGCEANLQGPFRLLRGYVYWNYLFHHFGGPLPNQSLVTVPGVAHDGDGMFNSPCGQMCLFDKSAATPPPSCGHICGH